MRTCTTEKTAENQKKLCQALLELAQKLPYERLFVSDICQRAQISRRSFYRYFTNKDDVLHALILDSIMECSVRSMELRFDVSNLQALLTRFFVFWSHERSELLDILRKNRLEHLLMDIYLDWAMKEVQAFPEWSVRRTAMTFSITGVMAVMFQWFDRNFDTPVEQLSGETASLLERIIYQP